MYKDTMDKRIQKEIKKCLMNTSMKGIPRAMKSETRCLRAFWILGILTLLVFTASTVWFQAIQYFTYEPSSAIHHIDLLFKDLEGADAILTKFPDITLCNMQKIGSQRIEGVKTYNEFLAFVTDTYDEYKQSNPDDKTWLHILKNHTKYEDYFVFLGPHKAKLVGIQQQNFIVQCHVYAYFKSSFTSGTINKI